MTQMPNIPNCSFEHEGDYNFLIDSEGETIDSFNRRFTSD